jgi:uncharacterized lipoprotein NlpE involved in copper resistance
VIRKTIFTAVILLLLVSGCDNDKEVGGDPASAESEQTIPSEGAQKVYPLPVPDPYPTY